MSRDVRAERVSIIERRGGERIARDDWLAVEEPLEIAVRHGDEETTLLTTMRTPGHDAELAVGLLFAEGVIQDGTDVLNVAHSDDPSIPRELRANRIVVTLADSCEFDPRARQFVASAACGVCGRQAVDDLLAGIAPIAATWTVSETTLHALPATLREAQDVFERTGGLHAFALFDLDGRLLRMREDIGRHNATDKAIGAAWLEGETPLSNRISLTSGRAGFEIAQKCARAGVPLLASVGAPSSLAVDVALESGMTLVGFLRDGRFNVYAGDARISG